MQSIIKLLNSPDASMDNDWSSRRVVLKALFNRYDLYVQPTAPATLMFYVNFLGQFPPIFASSIEALLTLPTRVFVEAYQRFRARPLTVQHFNQVLTDFVANERSLLNLVITTFPMTQSFLARWYYLSVMNVVNCPVDQPYNEFTVEQLNVRNQMRQFLTDDPQAHASLAAFHKSWWDGALVCLLMIGGCGSPMIKGQDDYNDANNWFMINVLAPLGCNLVHLYFFEHEPSTARITPSLPEQSWYMYVSRNGGARIIYKDPKQQLQIEPTTVSPVVIE